MRGPGVDCKQKKIFATEERPITVSRLVVNFGKPVQWELIHLHFVLHIFIFEKVGQKKFRQVSRF